MCYQTISKLSLIACLIFQIAISDAQIRKIPFTCAITSLEIPSFQCNVSFFYVEKLAVPECTLVQNKAVITVGMSSDRGSLFNISFSCTSTSSVSIANIQFKDRKPQDDYTQIIHERLIENYWEPASYKYKLDVLFPINPLFGFIDGEVVEYKIACSQDESVQLNVFFEIYSTAFSDICRTYYLQGDVPIDVFTERLVIPYIHFQNGTREANSVELYYLDEFLPVDNKKVSYNSWEGFALNTSYFNFSEDDYMQCSSHSCQYGQVVKLKVDSRDFSPKSKEIYLYGSRFNILERNNNNKGVTLSCNRKDRELHIKLLQFEGDDNATIDIKYSNYSLGTEKKHYFAAAQIPYLTEDERQNVTGWLDSTKNKISLECLNFGGTQAWIVHYDVKGPLRYSDDHKAFVCDGVHTLPGQTSKMTLRHWSCNSIFQCQTVFSYCLDDKELGDDMEYCLQYCGAEANSVEIKNDCMRPLQTNPFPCNRLGKLSGFEGELCEAVLPTKKGIVQCTSKSSVNFDIRILYFEGFDGKIYVESDEEEPPINAKIKITSFNTHSYFYTKGKFHFRCEAQSFFYENGIQWFFKYSDGTVTLPPKNCIETIKVQPQDISNPESNVNFCFEDLKVVEIICSAPILNSDRWENVSLKIVVEESSAPKIAPFEPVTFLFENAGDQSMTCQATGIPNPGIRWERFGQEIQEPLRVLEGQILIFPNYSKEYLGEYTCWAENVAGNVSQVFLVEKFEKVEDANSAHKNLYYLFGVLVFIVCMVALLVLAFLKSNTSRRYQEMKEIIQLLEGVQGKENPDKLNENVDPLHLPFKRSYEIEKKSFKIDPNNILGKGNFGEVYQGELEGVEGPVAFKTIRANCSLHHLKALASELKILMYIGQHENLVTLLGAYKKELEKGILLVAVEFCGLGSLESYLRTYRHLFLKCPLLSVISKIKRDINIEEQLEYSNAQPASLHSLQSLMKWTKQIASGMEYLAEKFVVHLDLATRNVLLTAEGNAKVTDFGLSRRLYNYVEYIKTNVDDPLPWKWMAPESFLFQTFSTKSDVWSYGITLWEIFSLGEVPYPMSTCSTDFLQQLKEGMRNKKPKYAPIQLYKLMTECWEYDPSLRPSFSSLRSTLESMDCNIIINIDIRPGVINRNVSIIRRQNNSDNGHPLPTNSTGYTKFSELF